MPRFFPFLLLPFLCSGQATLLQEWESDEDLRGASISYCVMDAKDGRVLLEHQSGLSIVPASTLKIFTTAAALDILGKGSRYETQLGYTGIFNPSTGVIEGDLVILGDGDPTLQSEHFGTGEMCSKWAEQLYNKGVREIRGTVVGDAGNWDRTIPDHWIWADIGNYFGAVPCGLSFRDNKFQLHFSSGARGTVANIVSVTPQYAGNRIIVNSSVTCEGSEDKAFVYGDPLGFERQVSGTIPPGKGKFEVEASLPDPALLCAEELLQALQKQGIRCVGTATSSYLKREETLSVLFSHQSPTLEKIVQQTNLRSNNHYCESLLLTLGKGSRAAGLAAVREYWRSKGLAVEGLFLTDGSGLSRASTCTTKLQCEALRHVYNDSTLYAAFNSSLPRAGRQGSMSGIGKGTGAENNLRAKTGYIQRVRAYCGYVKNKEGRDLAFSIIFNHYNCSPARARLKMEKFMVQLAGL